MEKHFEYGKTFGIWKNIWNMEKHLEYGNNSLKYVIAYRRECFFRVIMYFVSVLNFDRNSLDN